MIRAQDYLVAALPGSFRLGSGQAQRVIARGFALAANFFHRPRTHAEPEAGDAEQLTAAGRLRGENQIHSAMLLLMLLLDAVL